VAEHLIRWETPTHRRRDVEIEPVLHVESGDVVVVDTDDFAGGQIDRDSTAEDLLALDLDAIYPASELVCVAGGARGDLLRQICADLTGLPLTRPHDVETTTRGAAMLAAAGAGLHPDVPSAARVYRRHRELYSALRPLFS
jgi:acetamidase/formamidase